MQASADSATVHSSLQGRSLLIVEDDPAVARLVRTMLATQGCMVRVLDSVGEAERALPGDFDAVLLDVDLPDGSGFELLPKLHSGAQPMGVVIMTGNLDPQTVADSIRAGITEYLHKPFRLEQLLQAVSTAVHTTEQWRERMAAAHDVDAEEDTGERESSPEPSKGSRWVTARLARKGRLTAREQQVLSLILDGRRNTEIAPELDISVHTVKYHARNVLAKLGLESRLELFRVLAAESAQGD